MEATQLDARTVDLRALSDLIDQVKDLIANINEIANAAVGNALETLTGLIDTINAIKERFLNEGLTAISDAFAHGIGFIANKTEEAEKLGINIAKCITGKHEQLVELAIGLSGELTDCVSGPISAGLEAVNKVLKIIGEIPNNVSNLPDQLAKCLVSLTPITCVTDMLNILTQVVRDLPGQIDQMIDIVLTFVEGLPGKLDSCVNGISITVNSKVDAVIDEISKCVDELIPEQTFRL